MGYLPGAVEGEPATRTVLLRLFWGTAIQLIAMTAIEELLSVLLLAACALALAAQRRYLALQRKHKLLQRQYEKAEQQLSSLWASKKP